MVIPFQTDAFNALSEAMKRAAAQVKKDHKATGVPGTFSVMHITFTSLIVLMRHSRESSGPNQQDTTRSTVRCTWCFRPVAQGDVSTFRVP